MLPGVSLWLDELQLRFSVHNAFVKCCYLSILVLYMDMKRLVSSQWLDRIILMTSIGSCGAVAFLLNKIDSILNVQLYSFGLQFDTSWADPYWATAHLIYVLLGMSIVLSLVAIGLGFARDKQFARTQGTGKNVCLAPPQKVANDPRLKDDMQKALVKELKVNEESRLKENGGGLLVSCPNCKKVFSRPLVMLDFTGGKTRLVNVCPYCNLTLGEVENDGNADDSIHVSDLNEKMKQKT